MGCLDQSNAFTWLEVPRDWWLFQCGPRVRASELPASWVRGRWPPSRWLRPAYRRLAMGFTHAVALVVLVNLQIVNNVLSRERWLQHSQVEPDVTDDLTDNQISVIVQLARGATTS